MPAAAPCLMNFQLDYGVFVFFHLHFLISLQTAQIINDSTFSRSSRILHCRLASAISGPLVLTSHLTL